MFEDAPLICFRKVSTSVSKEWTLQVRRCMEDVVLCMKKARPLEMRFLKRLWYMKKTHTRSAVFKETLQPKLSSEGSNIEESFIFGINVIKHGHMKTYTWRY